MAFEDFESRDLISGISNSISSVIDEIEERRGSSGYTVEDFEVGVVEDEFHALRFTQTPEIFYDAIDILVRPAGEADSGVPTQMGSGRHEPVALILEIDKLDKDTGKIITENVTVVAKKVPRVSAEAELFVYNQIANKINHLEVVAILGSELDEDWFIMTTADPQLVALENGLSAEMNNLADISRIPPGREIFDIYQNYEYRIADTIVAGISEIRKLHNLGILHRDLEVKNVLQDLRFNPPDIRFVLCDFETSIARSGESDDSEINYDIQRYINSSIRILNKSLERERNLTDEQRQILQDSIDRIKAEVDKRV